MAARATCPLDSVHPSGKCQRRAPAREYRCHPPWAQVSLVAAKVGPPGSCELLSFSHLLYWPHERHGRSVAFVAWWAKEVERECCHSPIIPIHLQVADIAAAERYYVGVLGFERMTRMPSASFVSAGGYHHHIGMNTWAGIGVPAPPEGAARLLSYELILPT